MRSWLSRLANPGGLPHGVAIEVHADGIVATGRGGSWRLRRRYDDADAEDRRLGLVTFGQPPGPPVDPVAASEALALAGRHGEAAFLLDVSAAGHAHALGFASPSSREWGMRFYTRAGPDAPVSRLARAHPCLATILAGIVRHDADPGDGAAVVMSLARRAGAPVPSRASCARLLSSLWPNATLPEASLILGLPTDWWPDGAMRDPESRAAFRSLVPGAWDLRGILGHQRFLLASRGRWVEFAGRCLSACPPCPDGADPVAYGVMNFDEAARSMATEALVPCAASLVDGGIPDAEPMGARADAARVLAGDKGLPAIIALATRWDARRAFPRSPAADTSWPAAFPDTVLGDGILVTCLTDASALSDEGAPGLDGNGREGLAHCVGGYGPACLAGTCVIVSLRDPLGRRLSTAELSPQGWTVVQHRGPGNAPPPPQAIEALDAFVAAIAAGNGPTEEWSSPDWRMGTSTAPTSAQAEAALSGWIGYLPRSLRSREALAAEWSGKRGPVMAPPGRGRTCRLEPDEAPASDGGVRDLIMAILALATLPVILVAACAMAMTGRLSGGNPDPCLLRRARSEVLGVATGIAGLCLVAVGAAADGHPGGAAFLVAWSVLSFAAAIGRNRERLASWAKAYRHAGAILDRAGMALSGTVAPGSEGRSVYDARPGG